MIVNIKDYKVVAPKEFFTAIKEVSNMSFIKDKKDAEYWLDNAMYQVTYKKGNLIRLKRVLSY